MMNIPETGKVIYNFLPKSERARFSYELLECENESATINYIQKWYLSLFRDIKSQKGNVMRVGLVSAKSASGDPVNIVTCGDLVYINSDQLRSIKEVVKNMMIYGDVLVSVPHLKKTKDNKHRYYMRYLRVYKRLNAYTSAMPIHNN